MPERDKLLDLINSYKGVDCGGKYRNNVGGPVVNKNEFCSNYKFTIAVENTSSPGYTTEKLIDAWAAGTIPIYYGNPEIGNEFNTNAFINCHDYDSWEKMLEDIKMLDTDEEVYARMMSEPILLPAVEVDKLDKELEHFLLNIISLPKESAYRRDRYGWGKVYEQRMKYLYALKNMGMVKALYRIYRVCTSLVER